MYRKQGFKTLAIIVLAGLLTVSCSKQSSRTTGWAYNDANNGGFEVTEVNDQEIGPGLIAIEGGTFVMGATTDNLTYSWDNSPRKVTVPSFLMDRTEVSNVDYREYIYWLNRVYGQNYPQVVRNAAPDTLVWRDRLSYNEPMVEIYFRHPSYNDYPVVGVTWVQANDYCAWRTDRVNELMLVDAGILDWDPTQQDEENFNTDAYLAGQYTGKVKNGKKDLSKGGDGVRNVRMDDGILLPSYRLPTEAEWEYAAVGLVGNTSNELVSERKVYPWNGDGLRTDNKRYMGSFMANFKRGPGDYMGVAGNLNDGAALPAPVGSYWPNTWQAMWPNGAKMSIVRCLTKMWLTIAPSVVMCSLVRLLTTKASCCKKTPWVVSAENPSLKKKQPSVRTTVRASTPTMTMVTTCRPFATVGATLKTTRAYSQRKCMKLQLTTLLVQP